MSKKGVSQSHCVRITTEPYKKYATVSECLGPVLITGYDAVTDMDGVASTTEHHLPYDEDAVKTLLGQLKRRKRMCGSYLMTYSVTFHCDKDDDLKWLEEGPYSSMGSSKNEGGIIRF